MGQNRRQGLPGPKKGGIGRYKVEFENKVKGKLKDNVTGARPTEAGRALQIQLLTFGDKVDDLKALRGN